ncbi:hypothetical protein MTO96_052319 [Rhipicephalus appendiculatus]
MSTGALEIEERIGEQPCRGSHQCLRSQCCVVLRRGHTYKTCRDRPGLDEPCSTTMLSVPAFSRPSYIFAHGCPCRHLGHRCRFLKEQDNVGGVSTDV